MSLTLKYNVSLTTILFSNCCIYSCGSLVQWVLQDTKGLRTFDGPPVPGTIMTSMQACGGALLFKPPPSQIFQNAPAKPQPAGCRVRFGGAIGTFSILPPPPHERNSSRHRFLRWKFVTVGSVPHTVEGTPKRLCWHTPPKSKGKTARGLFLLLDNNTPAKQPTLPCCPTAGSYPPPSSPPLQPCSHQSGGCLSGWFELLPPTATATLPSLLALRYYARRLLVV